MSSYTNDGTPLTSTQVAAVDGQPLPPDHPFSSQMKEQIYNSVAQTQLNGTFILFTFSCLDQLCQCEFLRLPPGST